MVFTFNMIDHQSLRHILKMRSGDSLVLVTTFLLTVFVNLTIAVPVGLGLAMLSFIKRMSDVLEVEKIVPDMHAEQSHTEDQLYRCPQIASYTIHGPLFFGAADRFETIITRSINERPKVLILKMRHVSIIDVTGENNLASLVLDFQNKGGIVLISELENDPLEMLEMSGLFEAIGEHRFFKTTTAAINHALTLIETDHCPVCLKNGHKKSQTFVKMEETI